MSTNIDEAIAQIQARNLRVEADKAWETSKTRILMLCLLTYFVMNLLMLMIDVERPYLAALVPTTGFLLSTFSLRFIKGYWITRIHHSQTQD